MNSLYEGVLALIKSSVTGDTYAMPKDFSTETAAVIAVNHGIESMVYQGAVNCGFSKSQPGMVQLFHRCCLQHMYSERQMKQARLVLEELRKNAIHAMPLKGMIIRDLYPQPGMRRMGDADILIRTEQYPIIKNILKSLGYTYTGRTDHEIAWHHPHLRLELHTRLVPERNKGLYDYFGDGWRRARLQTDHLYAMSPEDTLVFLVAHVAKHYTEGGMGIQQFVDLWLYSQANPQLDQGYIQQELEKIQLDKFYACVLNMLQIWFGSTQWDSVSQEMTRFIFESGCYGTHRNHVLAQSAKQTGKGRRIAATLFPGYGEMKLRYPFLERWPALLPATWFVRGGNILLFHRNRVTRKTRDLQIATDKNVRALQAHFEAIGLRSNL